MWFPYFILVLAYFLGSLPTGYIAGKMAGIDIREQGSGSTGATNVWRCVGPAAGLSVFAVDFAKGSLAVWLMQNANSLAQQYLGIDSGVLGKDSLQWFVIAAGILVLTGHSRSIWLGFKGGKAVATGLGIVFTLNLLAGCIGFGTWLLTLAIWRTVSISSLCGAVAAPVAMWLLQPNLAYSLLTTAAGLFVLVRHKSNIERLLNGTELTFKKTDSGSESPAESSNS